MVQLGDEALQRKFFRAYISWLINSQVDNSSLKRGLIIDSTGLPNDIDFYLTAPSSHGGKAQPEARLILVIDRNTKMPLFFRYNAGNIVDVSTLKATLEELEAIGIGADMAIVDAGYYSEDNVRALYDRQVPFVTRLPQNRKLYKNLVQDYAETVQKAEYAQFFNDRLVFIRKVPVNLFGNPGFAFVAVDSERRSDEIKSRMKSMIEDKVPCEEIDRELKTAGAFILISSEDIAVSDILNVYYARQSVEQIFDINKNNVDLLPLRSHSERAFRGHLMLTFLASVAFLLVDKAQKNIGKTAACTSKLNATGLFAVMKNLKCKVYDQKVLVKEPTKKVKNAASKLQITLPETIPLW
jgi:transposase